GIYLVLTWIFASWSRPVVIMAVIPFGLIGAIYGHWWYDVPMSIFSIVGLIGMVGIIINDGIVLVTTIDGYAKERGLIPAIVDGVTDRLRPVLLTTLTTVLGLAPLLTETSTQAQFLKPTVITLVFGLSFGMVLVLIVIPALMAMQKDVGDMTRALRWSLRDGIRRRGAPTPVILPTVAVVILFGATLMYTILTGSVLGPLAAFPLSNMMAALASFVIGTAMICAMAYALTGISMARRGA
ncbi:MAG: efflux RND transporter permease subunit, partial [Pseudomonadota bacterium]